MEKGKFTKDYVKERTQELYDSLPNELEARKACLDVRDEIIKLNYKFFGYIASSVFIEGVEYEDKLQTALMSFMSMWWKYKWTPKYRGDLSFAVFFKPRISEEIRRYLNPISYTVKRVLCMKLAEQVGKKWTEVCFDDIKNAKLPQNDIIALKSILGSAMPEDISTYDSLIESRDTSSIDKYQTIEYDSIEEMLIQEMIERESPLSDKDLKNLADMLSLEYEQLKAILPKAMSTLYTRLKSNLE